MNVKSDTIPVPDASGIGALYAKDVVSSWELRVGGGISCSAFNPVRVEVLEHIAKLVFFRRNEIEYTELECDKVVFVRQLEGFEFVN